MDIKIIAQTMLFQVNLPGIQNRNITQAVFSKFLKINSTA